MIYIGIDDTDNHESRGTGRLARAIAQDLANDYLLLGVTRHQLLVDPRIPYTSHNSSAAICLKNGRSIDPQMIFERVKALILADFIAGSDPGLCVASVDTARTLAEFGHKAQTEVVTQAEACALAELRGALLAGLGGTQDGVIGALAAVGLAASGDDGRYLIIGNSRDLAGMQEINAVLASGITTVLTLNGTPVQNGPVETTKMRPARRNGQAVLFVEWQDDHWQPLKLN